MNFLKFILLIFLITSGHFSFPFSSNSNDSDNLSVTFKLETNSTANNSELIFKPKEVDTADYVYDEGVDEEYEYIYDEYETPTNDSYFNNNNNNNLKNFTSEPINEHREPKLELIYTFVAHILQQTTPNENTIETYKMPMTQNQSPKEPDYKYDNYNENDFDSNEDDLIENNLDEKKQWWINGNVCISKVTNRKEEKIPVQYWYVKGCYNKTESQFCITSIQSGSKWFEIGSTVFCCPTFTLNHELNKCQPAQYKNNLLEELSKKLKHLNETLKQLTNTNETHEEDNEHLFFMLNTIHEKLINELHNTQNSYRVTVFLWDNAPLLEYFKLILQQPKRNYRDKINKIVETIKNHIAKFHIITHSIVNNKVEYKSLANSTLRFSMLEYKNKTFEFVNCRKIVEKNHFYQRMPYGNEHDYRVLIHKLEKNGYLLNHVLTVQQYFLTNIINSKNEQTKETFSIFTQIYEKTNGQFVKDLDKPSSAITLFLPTNEAFKTLRKDQVNSLMLDSTCAQQFLAQFILYEEVCPIEIFKHQTNYSSLYQKAQFVTQSKKNVDSLYFNGQKVNTSKSTATYASNGAIYRLESVKIYDDNIRFLYDLLIILLKNSEFELFFGQLSPMWLNTLEEFSYGVTLLIPNQAKLSEPENYRLQLKQNSNVEFLLIKDYLINERFSHYQLYDSQILTTVNNKKYLVNVYPFEDSIPDIFSFAPVKNFERKSINCVALERNDIKACGSQILFLQSASLKIPELNSLDFWYFLVRENTEYERLIFLLHRCGAACMALFKNLSEHKSVSRKGGLKKGFTVLLPNDAFFIRNKKVFDKYLKDHKLFKKTIESNVFYGTYCDFALADDKLKIVNLLERKVLANKVAQRIQGSHVYLSAKGIIAYNGLSF